MSIPQSSQRMGNFSMHLPLVMGPLDIWWGCLRCYLLNIRAVISPGLPSCWLSLLPPWRSHFRKVRERSAVLLGLQQLCGSCDWKNLVQRLLLRDTSQYPALFLPCCFSLLFQNSKNLPILGVVVRDCFPETFSVGENSAYWINFIFLFMLYQPYPLGHKLLPTVKAGRGNQKKRE